MLKNSKQLNSIMYYVYVIAEILNALRGRYWGYWMRYWGVINTAQESSRPELLIDNAPDSELSVTGLSPTWKQQFFISTYEYCIT